MEEDAGRGAPGGEPGLSPGAEEKAKGAEAAGAVAAGGVVRGRGVGRGRSRTAVHILINTWAPGTQRVQGGWTDERQGGLQEGKTRGVGKGRRWSRTGVGDARSRIKARWRGGARSGGDTASGGGRPAWQRGMR